MSDFWRNLWNPDADTDANSGNGANGVDDYEVDPQKIRSMGLKRAGKDEYGNRVWKDEAGHTYNAAQLAKSDSSNDKNKQIGNNLPGIDDWQRYARGNNDTNTYVPPAVNFPTPKTAVYMPVLKSWVDVTNPYPVVNSSNKSAWQSQNSLPQEVNTTLKTIFISSHSGKFLEEKLDFIEPNPESITFKKENISIRAIADDDWAELKRRNVGSNETIKDPEVPGDIGYAIQSQQVQAEFDKLKQDLLDITKDPTIEYIDKYGQKQKKTIEKNLLIIFDRSKNKLTSLIQDFSGNDSENSYYQVKAALEFGDEIRVSAINENLIAIGMVHTHPLLPIKQSTNFTFNREERKNARGMSAGDKTTTEIYKMPDYAIEIYLRPQPVFVSKVTYDGVRIFIKNDFERFDNILNDSFNLFWDTLNIYFKWHGKKQ